MSAPEVGLTADPHPVRPGRGTADYPRSVAAAFADVDEYIRSFPAEVQVILEQVRQVIRDALPGCAETISYQMPTFTVGGRGLVHFAAWKNHLGLYPVPRGDEAFEQLVAPYRAAKDSARFRYDRPVPADVIERIVLLLLDRRGPAAG
jgi:uncharacterized protein YdhG (YjbR/CyaY superfamily)